MKNLRKTIADLFARGLSDKEVWERLTSSDELAEFGHLIKEDDLIAVIREMMNEVVDKALEDFDHA